MELQARRLLGRALDRSREQPHESLTRYLAVLRERVDLVLGHGQVEAALVARELDPLDPLAEAGQLTLGVVAPVLHGVLDGSEEATQVVHARAQPPCVAPSQWRILSRVSRVFPARSRTYLQASELKTERRAGRRG